jgi:hypothetical protein
MRLQVYINDGTIEKFTELALVVGLKRDDLVRRLVASYTQAPEKFEKVCTDIVVEKQRAFAVNLPKNQ